MYSSPSGLMPGNSWPELSRVSLLELDLSVCLWVSGAGSLHGAGGEEWEGLAEGGATLLQQGPCQFS